MRQAILFKHFYFERNEKKMEEINEKILVEMKNYYDQSEFDHMRVLNTKRAKTEVVNAVIRNNNIENDSVINNIVESYFGIVEDVLNHKIAL